MERKIRKSGIFLGAVAIALLMLSSATAVQNVQNNTIINSIETDKRTVNEEIEVVVSDDENGDEEPTIGPCTILLYSYDILPWCSMPSRFLFFQCEDLTKTRLTRFGLTGFFGYARFHGLEFGHRYKIYTGFWNPDVCIEVVVDSIFTSCEVCAYDWEDQ